MYPAIKALHVGCAILSIGGFVARGALGLRGSPLLGVRWVRIAPHVVDTVLLASALWLSWMSGQYPFAQGWLTAKVVALFAYIALGSVALRHRRSRRERAVAFALALGAVAYIVSVALSRDPLGPFAFLRSADRVAAQNYPQSVSDLVARTKAQIKSIDMVAFKSALDKRDAGLVVDVREPREYLDGHIPGAINIPRGQIELRIWPHVGFPDHTDMNRKITLYCGSGVRCILAAKSLQDLGLGNVIAVDMRIEDWAKAGYPLVTE